MVLAFIGGVVVGYVGRHVLDDVVETTSDIVVDVAGELEDVLENPPVRVVVESADAEGSE